MNNPPPADNGTEAKSVLHFLSVAKSWLLQITEAGFALTGFIVLLYLLLGADSGPYVVSVIANLSILVDAISPQAIVGISMVLALVYLLRRRN